MSSSSSLRLPGVSENNLPFSPRGNVSDIARSQSMKTNFEALKNGCESLAKSTSTPNANYHITRKYTLRNSVASESSCSSDEEDPYLSSPWLSDVKEVGKEKENKRRSMRIESLVASEAIGTRSAERWNMHLKGSTEAVKASSFKDLFFTSFHTIFRTKLQAVYESLPRLMTPSAIDDIVEQHILEVVKSYDFNSEKNDDSPDISQTFSAAIVSHLKENDLLVYPIKERAKFLNLSFCDLKTQRKSKKENISGIIKKIAELKSPESFVNIWTRASERPRIYIQELIHQEPKVSLSVIHRIQWWLSDEGSEEIRRKVTIFVADYYKLSNPSLRRYCWNGSHFIHPYSPHRKLRWSDATRDFTSSSPLEDIKKKYFINGKSIPFKETEKENQCVEFFRQFYEALINEGIGREDIAQTGLNESEKEDFFNMLQNYLAFMSAGVFEESVLTLPLIILLKPNRLNDILDLFNKSIKFLETREEFLTQMFEREYYFYPKELEGIVNSLNNILKGVSTTHETALEIVVDELTKQPFILSIMGEAIIEPSKLGLMMYLEPAKYLSKLKEILLIAESLKSIHTVKAILLGILYSPDSFLACVSPYDEITEILKNPVTLAEELKKNKKLKEILEHKGLLTYIFANSNYLNKFLADPIKNERILDPIRKAIPILHKMNSYLDGYPQLIPSLINNMLDVFVMTTPTGAFIGEWLFRQEKAELFKLWGFQSRRLEKCNITIDLNGDYTVAHFFRCTNEQATKDSSNKAIEFFFVSELKADEAEGKAHWKGVVHIPFLTRGLTKQEDRAIQWQIDRKLPKQDHSKLQELPDGMEISENTLPLNESTLKIIQEYAGIV